MRSRSKIKARFQSSPSNLYCIIETYGIYYHNKDLKDHIGLWYFPKVKKLITGDEILNEKLSELSTHEEVLEEMLSNMEKRQMYLSVEMAVGLALMVGLGLVICMSIFMASGKLKYVKEFFVKSTFSFFRGS